MNNIKKIRIILKDNKRLQIFLAFAPLFLTVIYISAYVVDLFNIFSVLSNNNAYAEQDMKSNNLYEVTSIEPFNNDKSYRVVLSGEVVAIPNVEINDVIYECYLTGDIAKPFKYERPELSYETEKDSLLEVDSFSNSGTTINYHIKEYYNQDLTDLTTSKGILVYKLILKDSGYSVKLYDKDGKKIKTLQLENIPSVEVLDDEDVDNNTKKLNLTKSFDVILTDNSYNFCNSLPKDCAYYSISSGVLVKNVSTSYAKDFIMKSNMFIVVASMTVFLAFFWFCYKNRDYEILSKKSLFMFTVALCCIMPILIFCTYSLLGVYYE